MYKNAVTSQTIPSASWLAGTMTHFHRETVRHPYDIIQWETG